MWKEIVVSVLLIALTVACLNPFEFWMPDMAVKAMLIITILVFALFAIFIIREQPQDEREISHRMHAGRSAFLVGSTLLVLGIVLQVQHHSVDPWLVIVLVGMVLSKIATRVYSDYWL